MLNLPSLLTINVSGHAITPLCLAFTIVFFFVSIAECLAAFFEKEMARRWIKPFCMISLFAAVLSFCANTKLLFIYLAIIFAFLGDLFMMFKRRSKIYLILGTIFFFDGHLCYLAHFFFLYRGYLPSYFIFIILGWVALFAIIHVKSFIRLSHHNVLGIGLSFYLSLFTALFICLLASVIVGVPYLWLSLIGCLIFISSDLMIVGDLFKKIFKKRADFWIMLTYLPGQFLLVLGFLLCFVLF